MLTAQDERMVPFIQSFINHPFILNDFFLKSDWSDMSAGQWLEDARPRAIIASLWFNDTSLRRVFLRTIAQTQFASGNFQVELYESMHTIMLRTTAFLNIYFFLIFAVLVFRSYGLINFNSITSSSQLQTTCIAPFVYFFLHSFLHADA
jgi:hypothetical protein